MKEEVVDLPVLYDGAIPVDYQAIKYDWIGASEKGVNEHPEKNVQKLGMKVYGYAAYGIGDCSIMIVDKVPSDIPEYISLFALDNEMIKFLGWK